jgi:hypothetical protein
LDQLVQQTRGLTIVHSFDFRVRQRLEILLDRGEQARRVLPSGPRKRHVAMRTLVLLAKHFASGVANRVEAGNTLGEFVLAHRFISLTYRPASVTALLDCTNCCTATGVAAVMNSPRGFGVVFGNADELIAHHD